MVSLALTLAASLQSPAPLPPWSDVLRRVAGSVVSIRSRVRVAMGRDEVGTLEGTGFLIDSGRGLIATNRHVAGEGVVLDLEVGLPDGSFLPAQRVYADPLHDFAFLRFDPRGAAADLAAIRIADREPVVGEEIRMVGNNGGLALTVLPGTLSNLGAAWDQDPDVAYLQTSIASAGGSSGSPIVDRAGLVLGMQAAHDEHHSYALPARYIATALESLQAGRIPARGTVGLRLRPTDTLQARASGALRSDMVEGEGAFPSLALVDGIVPDSPAFGLLVPGDVVFSVGGIAAGAIRDVERLLDTLVGKQVDVRYARNSVASTVSLRVADLAADGADRLALFAGAAFQDVSYEIRARTDLRRRGALLAYVAPGSAAEAAGLQRDDLLLSLGGREVTDAEALWRLVSSAREGEKLVLVMRRPSSFDSATRTLTLVADRTWDPSRFLVRGAGGWSEAPLRCEASASSPAR
jgi:pro-apoptotic serine protease NMA111